MPGPMLATTSPLASRLAAPTPRPRRNALLPTAWLACLAAALAVAGCASHAGAPTPAATPAEPLAGGAPPTAGLLANLDRADGVVLVLHGGVGTVERDELTPALEAELRGTLEEALRAGHRTYKTPGAAPERVVIDAVRVLEDSPLFNAGRGAVLTHERRHELDASLMVGAGPRAGAVAGVTAVRHPIELAARVMDTTPHVFFAGPAADAFAASLAGEGLELVPNSWFTIPRRVEQLDRALADEARRTSAVAEPGRPRVYLGTVGAVARDAAGRLAAGTSTGGMTNKRHGRVGDSPVIGAGTWADDRTVGVSCTGHGEFFIRGAVAHDVHARMLHGGQDLAAACQGTLAELSGRGGEGGFIALTPAGAAAAAFNTPGMYRGWIDAEGRVSVRIFED